ncbi:M23 family metallopeptidase [Dysgonomonas macrotermitis]|uniref:Peptidase family M23 n=1 Tax=Dysgonomonas macrotermitis TaxID=1346286 RepID=A0A1M4U574_9BACT|nr:M23 family metallopeptidase [Dysgonomonas macrotermitis]SHE51760.1 Peptidase family M23 [Dysgonomonas macrotermitis]
MNRLTYILILSLFSINSFSQDYRSPLDIPLLLSGNCGELRNNHFHAGLDIKTQGVEGKSVYSVADGFVSRISVSPSGYGLALYIDHPNGQTTVYGHLSRFNKEISDYVKSQQYAQESYRVNLSLKANQIKVKKGDVVAYSGNTGGSGGPHLHFEIRDTKSEHVLDPLPFLKSMIRDEVAPEIRGIAAYPVPGRGAVNSTFLPLRQTITKLKDGSYSSPQENIEAWGLIGLGIKAYDRMSGTTNIYGVRTISMKVDDKQVFSYDISRFAFDQSRMINTFTDFVDWRLNKSFYMYSFVEPGNTLPFYQTQNSGYININEERTYNIEYTLQDVYGNSTIYKFTVNGKQQDIPRPSGCSLVMIWDQDNKYISERFSLIINKGNLYNDVCFTLSQSASSDYFSDVFTVNQAPVALDKSGEVRIKLNFDPLSNKKQYGIVQLTGNRKSWIGGTYNNGTISGNIRELGVRLAVASDTQAPTISPVTTAASKKKKAALPKSTDSIRLRITDNLSGVASVRGTIDGKFALFENDIKSPVYTYKFDPDRLSKGTHNLIVVATDACGNSTEYSTEFTY